MSPFGGRGEGTSAVYGLPQLGQIGVVRSENE